MMDHLRASDPDVFAFQLDAGDPVTANVTYASAGADQSVTLFGPDQAKIAEAASGGATDSLTHVATEAGTYYVSVVATANRANACFHL